MVAVAAAVFVSVMFLPMLSDDAAAADPPLITTTSLPDGKVGVPYSEQLDADGDTPITWTSDDLPEWLTLSSGGVLSGTPTSSGTFEFTVKASNGYDPPDTKTLSIFGPVPPSITTESLLDGKVGVSYSVTLAAGEDETITWTSDDLSGWLTLSPDGVLSGTPTSPGTFTFIVKATNDGGTDTRSLSIFVPVPPSITTTSLPDGIVGGPYSKTTLTADGKTPITWSIAGGNLPGGLSLSEEGEITGTPTASGTFQFDVKATNDDGTDTRSLSIIIPPTPPSITTTSLPGGTVGVLYSQTLTATGDRPILWDITSGSLPEGLQLDTAGTIFGTPRSSGTFQFTVRALNNNEPPDTDTRQFSITIAPAKISISGKVITEFDGTDLDDIRIYVNKKLIEGVDINGKGEFKFDVDVGSSEYTIMFEKKGSAVRGYFYDGDYTEVNDLPLTLNVSDNNVELHVILLDVYGTVTGTVTRNNAPMGGIIIEVHDVDADILYTGTTGADGKYSFSLPIKGNYLVSVNSKNFLAEGKEDGVSVENLGTNNPPIDFKLVPKQIVTVTISISGKVITEFDGTGFGDIRIYINEKLINTTVDKDGEFEFDVDVGSAEYTIRFEKKGFAVRGYFYLDEYREVDNLPLPLYVSDGDVDLRVILLEAYGTIAGTVTRDNVPVGGIMIEVYDIDTELRYTKTTDGGGNYSFSLPVGGNYHVSVNARNFAAEGKEDGVRIDNLGIHNPSINFELVPRQGAVYLFGYDLTHSLMLIGGIVGLFMLIFTVLYRIHIKRNPELSKVHSDSLERKRMKDQ
jgi:cytochrome c2